MPPEYDITAADVGGQRAMVIQPSILDDLDPDLKSALAARRVANVTGECPACGARVRWPNRAERRAAARAGRAMTIVFVHEDDCVALCDGD
ncbi:hypothetical protein QQM39_28425 [Streptomyces sp. DT2A-34]|uniref:hypothetical protein n=1 Tax=Streptomyces sp. DT2A-34 TaxID=3051182 RepID=UPI00265B7B30|nr:hypothetical protein [Streptomyces sp. DT2A-34]MDO0914618.1 hypothetical protein [Streptomyces sp. DT2A-34]